MTAFAQACTAHIATPQHMGQDAVGVEPTHLMVVFKGVRLDSTRQLANYGIDDSAAVHLVRLKRGWIYLAMHDSVLEVTATWVDAR